MRSFTKYCGICVSLVFLACVSTSVGEKVIESTITEVESNPREVTAEDIAHQWLSLAKEQKWGEMTKIAQLTWVSKQGSKAAEKISYNYDFFDIRDWTIISTVKKSDTFYTITVEVDTQLGKKVMKASVIREIAPYQPSIHGKWGVNPISAMLH